MRWCRSRARFGRFTDAELRAWHNLYEWDGAVADPTLPPISSGRVWVQLVPDCCDPTFLVCYEDGDLGSLGRYVDERARATHDPRVVAEMVERLGAPPLPTLRAR